MNPDFDELAQSVTPAAPPEIELAFADIRAALADDSSGTPTVFVRNDGAALLYRRAVNGLAGEPGEGKTTLAAIAAVQIIAEGGLVLYLDAEDTATRVARRMVALGGAPEQLCEALLYLPYDNLVPDTEARVALLQDLIRERDIGLVVIDGVADALGVHGLDEDRAADYARWHALVARPLAQADNAAILLIDHVVKSRENRGGWPRGSGHKLAAIDGAIYLVNATTPFSRVQAGVVELTIAKDRAGHVGPKKARAARIFIAPVPPDGGIATRVEPPAESVTDESGESGEPSLTPAFLELVLAAVVAAQTVDGVPGPTRARVADELRSKGVRFDKNLLTPALLALDRAKRIVRYPRRGGGHHHEVPPTQLSIGLVE